MTIYAMYPSTLAAEPQPLIRVEHADTAHERRQR